jgi:hypothetical protein
MHKMGSKNLITHDYAGTKPNNRAIYPDKTKSSGHFFKKNDRKQF